ncbi:14434_t:CDS:2, partial [Cetraspora pellucida]
AVPENTQFVAIMTFCCAIDIQSLRLICSKFGGFDSFSSEFSQNAQKAIAWASVINIFIEDIPQFIIQIHYKTHTLGYSFVPFVSLILSCCVLATSLERLFYAVDRGPCTRDCFTFQRNHPIAQTEGNFARDWAQD